MASMSSLTRAVLHHLAPALEAAVAAAAPLAPTATGAAGATGGGTGLHPLPHHQAAGLLLALGLVLTLGATGGPPAVAATAIADTAMVTVAAPHLAVTGPTHAPTAAHPRQTGALAAQAKGPAPGLPSAQAGTGGL